MKVSNEDWKSKKRNEMLKREFYKREIANKKWESQTRNESLKQEMKV